MESTSKNYFSHELPSDGDTESISTNIQKAIQLIKTELERFQKIIPPNEVREICSRSWGSFACPSIYTGAGGYLSLYIRLVQFAKGLSNSEIRDDIIKEIPLLADEKALLELAENSLESLAHFVHELVKKKNLRVTYLMGPPGYYLNGCFVAFYKNNSSSFATYLDRLLAFKTTLVSQEDLYMELLYGVSGYLYCLLVLQKNFSKKDMPKEFYVDLSQDIYEMTSLILKQGIEDFSSNVDLTNPPNNFRLTYFFHQKEYFGGAHGLFGVLYMIMTAYQQNKEYFNAQENSISEKLLLCCKTSLEFLMKLQLPSGNFPPSTSHLDKDSLVQFCHGSPGAVPCLLKAIEVYETEDITETLMKSAIKAGENVWTCGLLKKGFGLCHGISGNAYTFISLYRLTKNNKWLNRALEFALVKTRKDVMSSIQSYKCPGRKVTGTPDAPYSLMEGLAGDICFFLDLLDPLNARFPGYEV